MTERPRIVPFHPSARSVVVRFWNETFASQRNFFPMTEELFRRRIEQADSPFGRFNPDDLLLAEREPGGPLAGLIHLADRPGDHPRAIALLAVHPSDRRRGVGAALLAAARQRAGADQPLPLDGQGFNPFYGNPHRPITPFWGTPEGISVAWDDGPVRSFFTRAGFEPRFRAVTLELALPARGVSPPAELAASTRLTREPVPDGGEAQRIVATLAGRAAGLIIFYPMTELGPGRQAIYSMEVDPADRGQGLGRALLHTALGAMEEAGAVRCEVLTIPSESPGAHHLYLAAGFCEVGGWAIY